MKDKTAVKKLAEKLLGLKYCPVWFFEKKVETWKKVKCINKDLCCCKFCGKTCQMRCSQSLVENALGTFCNYSIASLEYALRKLEEKNSRSFSLFVACAQNYRDGL